MEELALFGGPPTRQTPWPRPRMIDQNPTIVDIVTRTFDGGLTFFTSRAVSDLERKLVETFDKHYAVAVSSGTAALETALHSLGICSVSDEVIVPSATYISSASAIVRNGGTPVFVDCDDSLTMSIDTLQRTIHPQTKAVVFVSLFGNPGNIEEVYEICRHHKIPLVHDCAQGAATKRNGQWIASIGDITCLSFFETKHLPGGEGGAILTDCEDIYTRAKSFSNLFETRNDGIPTAIEFDFRLPVFYPDIGTNYRLSALSAALVTYALEHLEETQGICHQHGTVYMEALAKWGTFPRTCESDEIGWYGLPLLLGKKRLRDGFWKALHCEGTPVARYYYTCLPHNSAFAVSSSSYPVTEALVANALILPTHKAIGPQERADLIKAFKKVGEVLWLTC